MVDRRSAGQWRRSLTARGGQRPSRPVCIYMDDCILRPQPRRTKPTRASVSADVCEEFFPGDDEALLRLYVHRPRVGAATEPRRGVNSNIGARAWKCAVDVVMLASDTCFSSLGYVDGIRAKGYRVLVRPTSAYPVCLPAV